MVRRTLRNHVFTEKHLKIAVSWVLLTVNVELILLITFTCTGRTLQNHHFITMGKHYKKRYNHQVSIRKLINHWSCYKIPVLGCILAGFTTQPLDIMKAVTQSVNKPRTFTKLTPRHSVKRIHTHARPRSERWSNEALTRLATTCTATLYFSASIASRCTFTNVQVKSKC